jgi:hypothetical protein
MVDKGLLQYSSCFGFFFPESLSSAYVELTSLINSEITHYLTIEIVSLHNNNHNYP